MRSFLRAGLWAGLALSLVVAAYQVMDGPSVAAPLVVRPDPFIVPFEMVSGEHYDVEVPIVNASPDAARLIGSLDYCGGSCVGMRDLPTAIPARGTALASVRIEARTPGLLSEELTVYTDRPSQPMLLIRLQGTVLEAPADASRSRAPADGA